MGLTKYIQKSNYSVAPQISPRTHASMMSLIKEQEKIKDNSNGRAET